MTIAVESDNIKQLLYFDGGVAGSTPFLRTGHKKAPMMMITGAANKPDYV